MKNFPRYRHLKTGIDFFIVGATETSTGRRCFVCRETPLGRERLFEIDGFDVAFVEREATFLILLKKETARRKSEEKLARTKRRRAEACEEEENLEARADETSRPPWEFIPEGSDDPLSDDEQDGERIAQESEIIEPEIIEATEF